MITIEIENPMEVAKRESIFARAFGELARDLVKRKVDERVAQDIEESLTRRGIRAVIRVR